MVVLVSDLDHGLLMKMVTKIMCVIILGIEMRIFYMFRCCIFVSQNKADYDLDMLKLCQTNYSYLNPCPVISVDGGSARLTSKNFGILVKWEIMFQVVIR